MTDENGRSKHLIKRQLKVTDGNDKSKRLKSVDTLFLYIRSMEPFVYLAAGEPDSLIYPAAGEPDSLIYPAATPLNRGLKIQYLKVLRISARQRQRRPLIEA